MLRSRTVGTAVALAVSCGLTLTLGAAPASAIDRAPDRAKPVVALTPLAGVDDRQAQTFSVALTKTATTAQGAVIQEVIYCGGYVTYPARSAINFPPSVRVDVVAQCDSVVDMIEIIVGITIDGTLGPDGYRPVGPANYNSHYVLYPCPGGPRVYRGVGAAKFFKAGYQNSPMALGGATPNVTVNC